MPTTKEWEAHKKRWARWRMRMHNDERMARDVIASIIEDTRAGVTLPPAGIYDRLEAAYEAFTEDC